MQPHEQETWLCVEACAKETEYSFGREGLLVQTSVVASESENMNESATAKTQCTMSVSSMS